MIKNIATALVATAFLAAPVWAQTTAPAPVPEPPGAVMRAAPEKPVAKKIEVAKKAAAKKPQAAKAKAAPGAVEDPQD